MKNSIGKKIASELAAQREKFIQGAIDLGHSQALAKKMFDDVAYWLEQDTGLTHDEIAAQLHHRITYIHPFPNGNGRLARMMADLLLEQLKCPPFTWGTGDHQGDAILSDPAVRERYVQAVKAADGKNFEPLMGFVRS